MGPTEPTAKALEDRFPVLKRLGIGTDEIISKYRLDSHQAIYMTDRYDRLRQSLTHSSF